MYRIFFLIIVKDKKLEIIIYTNLKRQECVDCAFKMKSFLVTYFFNLNISYFFHRYSIIRFIILCLSPSHIIIEGNIMKLNKFSFIIYDKIYFLVTKYSEGSITLSL
jgi:hypothetical protein